MAASHPALFEAVVTVEAMDKGGKVFDRVSRIEAKSRDGAIRVTLDVNTEVFPLHVADTLSFALKEFVFDSEVGQTGPQTYRPHEASRDLEEADYAMHGVVYRLASGVGPQESSGVAGQANLNVYISFGGLLLRLTAPVRELGDFRLDSELYLLLKRVDS